MFSATCTKEGTWKLNPRVIVIAIMLITTEFFSVYTLMEYSAVFQESFGGAIRWYSSFRTQITYLGNTWLLRFRLDPSYSLKKGIPRIRYFVDVCDQHACLKQSKLERIYYILANIMSMPFLLGKLYLGLPTKLLISDQT